MSTGRSDQSDVPMDQGQVDRPMEPLPDLLDAPPTSSPRHTRVFPATAISPPERPRLRHQTDDDSTDVTLWLKKADRLLLGTLLIALLILLIAFRLKLSGWGQSEIEIVDQQPREYVYHLDINTASWVEWAQLDGIGEKLARRIVQDRTDHGPFVSLEDVGRVRGLGPKLIEKLMPYLKCPACESEQQSIDQSTN